MAAERKRLEGLIGKAAKQIAAGAAKLSRPDFVDRAPRDVVEKERENVRKMEEEKRQLEESMRDLA